MLLLTWQGRGAANEGNSDPCRQPLSPSTRSPWARVMGGVSAHCSLDHAARSKASHDAERVDAWRVQHVVGHVHCSSGSFARHWCVLEGQGRIT